MSSELPSPPLELPPPEPRPPLELPPPELRPPLELPPPELLPPLLWLPPPPPPPPEPPPPLVMPPETFPLPGVVAVVIIPFPSINCTPPLTVHLPHIRPE